MSKQKQASNNKPGAVGPRKRPALPWIRWALSVLVVPGVILGVLLWRKHTADFADRGAETVIGEGAEVEAEAGPFIGDAEQEKSLRHEQLEAVEKLVKAFPNNDDAIYLAGCVHNEQGDSVTATKWWERSLALDETRADAWDNLGNALLFQDEYEKAVSHFRKALEVDPTLTTARHRLAQALSHLGRLDEVISVLEKCDAWTAESHQLMADTCLQLKEDQRAKTNYEAAIRLDPLLVQAYYGLSRACARLGEKDKSSQYWEKFSALKKQREDKSREWRADFSPLEEARKSVAKTHTDVGRVYLTQGRAEEAEAWWLRAAGLDPDNVLCRLQLAVFYQQRRRHGEAVRFYEEITRLDPGDALAQLNLGRVYLRLKRFQEAERAFREAIRLKPNRPEGYGDLAGLYLQTRKHLVEARRLAEQAVSVAPEPVYYALLSRACVANADRDGALSAIEHAIVIEPNNQEYLRARELLVEIP